MRSLDTNVLVRYLTTDDPRQARTAERVIEECRSSGEPIYLTVIMLCELVWVLGRSYGEGKTVIVGILEHLLELDQVRLEREDAVRRSLEIYRHGPASFSDYLIGEISREDGSRDTVTFDRALRGAPGFTVLR